MIDTAAPLSGPLRDNIAALTRRARDEARTAPLPARVADRITAFTGSMTFVVLHLVLVVVWTAVNLGVLAMIPRFDPSFVILACAASVEAIFLSTFVLISQNRMAAVADRRADLDLHVNLLAEHELSQLSALVVRIAERLEVPVDHAKAADIASDVDATRVLDALDQRRREEGLEH